MKWKFWQDDDEQDKKIDKLVKLNEKLQERLTGMEEKLNKLNRFQYKQFNDLNSRLNKLEKKTTNNEILERKNKQLKQQNKQQLEGIKQFCLDLFKLIDKIDHVLSGMDDDNDWKNVFEEWLQLLLNNLNSAGIYQIDLKGKEFDPKRAEAIKSVTPQELQQENKTFKEYEVVEIVNRGFVDEQDNVLRKAKVITVKGSDDYVSNKVSSGGGN